jgi:hypothetical protein
MIVVKNGKRIIIVVWNLAVSNETAMACKINYLITRGVCCLFVSMPVVVVDEDAFNTTVYAPQ